MEQHNIWYEDDGFTLHVQDRVYYTQCGANNAMSLFELLKKTTDISTEDFRRRGMSMDFLRENGFARVVSRSSFRIHRMPRRDEQIELVTAEEQPEALQLVQSYEILGADGEHLISGVSTWMLIDPATRRILPTKLLTLRTPNSLRKAHDCLSPGRIPRPAALHPLAVRTVGVSCLDGNGHADNAWYITFVLDALPPEYASRTVTDFRINYSKELLLGDTLSLSVAIEQIDEQGGAREKVTVIGEKDGGLSFECELYFA